MKLGLRILEKGADSVPKNMEMPLPFVPAKDTRACPGTKFVDGCNFFAQAKDSFVTEIFEPELLPESTYEVTTAGTAFEKLSPLPDNLSAYEQPAERRILTRGTCDDGWTNTTDNGIAACKKN